MNDETGTFIVEGKKGRKIAKRLSITVKPKEMKKTEEEKKGFFKIRG